MRTSLATWSTVAVILAAGAQPAHARQAEPLTVKPIRWVTSPTQPRALIRFEPQMDRLPTEMSPRRVQSRSKVKRGLWAAAGGVGGFFGGGYLGAKLEPDCNCDDPGLQGFLIGAPIGALVGAILGWKYGR